MKLINTNTQNDFFVEEKPVKEYTMLAPIPESIDWHRLTGFREVGKLKTLNPALYAEWKKRGLIPSWILKKENESQYQG